MKKIITIALALIMLAGMTLLPTSCAKGGKIVCGVTDYEPMNFMVGGEWTGFDTEFAQLVADKLGMEVEFQEIDWAQKFSELDSGAIDAIRNGFTATASENGVSRMDLCDVSYSYMLNTQCVVLRNDRLGEFPTVESLAGMVLAAESGSAGQEAAEEVVGNNGDIIGVAQQINAFLEVKTGAVDGAVIDIILARQIAGTGDYSDLSIAFELEPEVYAVGFRKGDALRNKVNKAMKELFDAGKVLEIAEKYGVEANLYLDTSFGK